MLQTEGDEELIRDIQLRHTSAEDEPFLMNLFATTRETELAHLNFDDTQRALFIRMQFNAQNMQYAMSYPKADSSVILSNNEPIGRLLVDRAEHEFTLVDIALLPTHRGTGVGGQLIKDLLREAAEQGKAVKLSVWQTNPAKKLYERLGFAAVGDAGVYCEMRWTPTSKVNHP
jgi:ribosomal protein S18 acetylase RimI-like enzyme